MANVKTFALLPVTELRRWRKQQQIFGEREKEAAVDKALQMDSVLKNPKLSNYNKKFRYERSSQEFKSFLKQAKSKPVQPSTSAPPPVSRVVAQSTKSTPQPVVNHIAAVEPVDHDLEEEMEPEVEVDEAEEDMVEEQPEEVEEEQLAGPSHQAAKNEASVQEEDEDDEDAFADASGMTSRVEDFVHTLPPRVQAAAESALNKLSQYPENVFSINDDFSINFRNELVPNSDVREIVRRLHAPPVVGKTPVGFSRVQWLVSGANQNATKFIPVSKLGQ